MPDQQQGRDADQAGADVGDDRARRAEQPDQCPGEAGVVLMLLTGLPLPPVAPLVTKVVPPQGVVVLAVALVGIGAAWLTVIGPGASVLSIAGPLLTVGAGFGISTGLIDGVAIGSVDPARAGTGAGMFNAVRLALETIAIAVVGAVLATTTGGRLAEPGYTSGLHVALWGMAGLAAVLTVVLARVLPRRRETTARQHPEPSQA
ncbi:MULTISPECIES: hypothetical protein [Actinosynnema]|uniref:hypothetical protein n=1 Tax=Actinosynnema TaxID=40566 RepID=UPI0020A36496|nr:hypothetical protein [Actinosynnema pretiosum]MCP2095061.1 hypothetical protein [Actinosynnema pretiosum]